MLGMENSGIFAGEAKLGVFVSPIHVLPVLDTTSGIQ
jgi:hypothetical protein